MTRYLFYSHDSYGLGHFRRSSLLAAGLVGARQDNEVLIITGSPRAQAFRLPERVDTIKLPTATKNERGGYQPRKLGSGIDALVRMRSTIIGAAAKSYEPDVVVVDHSPTGMAGELRPLFDRYAAAGAHRPRIVLGLRDIIDDASTVHAAWTRDGIWDYLDRSLDSRIHTGLHCCSHDRAHPAEPNPGRCVRPTLRGGRWQPVPQGPRRTVRVQRRPEAVGRQPPSQ